MKVLHLVNAKVIGGGERYVYDLAANTDVDKVVIAADSSCKEVFDLYRNRFDTLDVILRSVMGLGALPSLVRFIRKEHIDILNCHSGTLAFLSVLLKKLCPWLKLVVFRHNVRPNRRDFLHRWLQKHFDAIICVSKAVYDVQRATIAEHDKNKLHLVYNGVDLQKFSKYPEKTYELHDVLQLGFAGRVVKNKGVEIALAALAKLKQEGIEFQFKIAGPCDDDYREILQQYIADKDLNDEVQFLGVQNDMEKFYKSIDILLAPSIVKEAFGLSVSESMYCGTPVITSNSGGQTEIITDGKDGIILKNLSSEELAKEIKQLSEPDVYEKLQRNGKNKIVHKFAMTLCATKISEIYYYSR